jgi:hypothetical protein
VKECIAANDNQTVKHAKHIATKGYRYIYRFIEPFVSKGPEVIYTFVVLEKDNSSLGEDRQKIYRE